MMPLFQMIRAMAVKILFCKSGMTLGELSGNVIGEKLATDNAHLVSRSPKEPWFAECQQCKVYNCSHALKLK